MLQSERCTFATTTSSSSAELSDAVDSADRALELFLVEQVAKVGPLFNHQDLRVSGARIELAAGLRPIAGVHRGREGLEQIDHLVAILRNDGSLDVSGISEQACCLALDGVEQPDAKAPGVVDAHKLGDRREQGGPALA